MFAQPPSPVLNDRENSSMPYTPDPDLEHARLLPQSVTIIAQSISHLPPLAESAACYLAPDAEYRIRQIIQDSLKFMKHSRRSCLMPDDVNSALHIRNVDPVFGFGPQNIQYTYRRLPVKTRQSTQSSPPATPSRFAQSAVPIRATGSNSSAVPEALSHDASASSPVIAGATATSNASMQHMNNAQTDSTSSDLQESPSVYTLSVVNANGPDPPSFAPVLGIPDLFFACDEEHNLHDLLLDPLPPVPLEATVLVHWLAVDSKQPSIPQNPSDQQKDGKSKALAGQNGYVSNVLQRNKRHQRKGERNVSKAKRKRAERVDVEIIPRVKHVLSRETQMYFDYVRKAIFNYDPTPIEWALKSLATEHGIVQLLPYLTHFIATTTRFHMKDLPLLFSLMRLVDSLVENKALNLEAYLHQVLPACVSCLVGKRLCSHPRENHWALRDFSAGLLRRVCDRFGKDYQDIKPRLTVTLDEALNLDRPLTTHYGAIVGMGSLGPLTIKRFLIPRLPAFAEKVKAALEATGPGSVRRFEAAKVYFALAWAIARKDFSSTSAPSQLANGHLPINSDSMAESFSIRPELIADLLPGSSQLISSLEEEFEKRLFPLGDRAFDIEVANDILKTASQN